MTSPFPASITKMTLPFPIMIPGDGPRPDLSELDWEFTKTAERNYNATPPDGGGDETMYVATYSADTTWFGTKSAAFVANENSGEVDMMVDRALIAFARNEAFNLAYDEQPEPAPPKPDNPGLGFPLYAEAIEAGDGTGRLRGFCAGLRWVDPGGTGSVDVYVEKVFYEEP